MAQIVRIGENYYGIEVEDVAISDEIISRVDLAFEQARQMTDDQFNIELAGAASVAAPSTEMKSS